MKDKSPQGLGLATSNYARSQAAAMRDAQRARQAMQAIQRVHVSKLTLVQIRLRQQYMQVLRVRVQHPQATLQQLAGRCNVSKDVYSARLKRAFNFAERIHQYDN